MAIGWALGGTSPVRTNQLTRRIHLNHGTVCPESNKHYSGFVRKILIAAGLLVLTLIIGGAYAFHRIDSQLARDSREKLAKLEPRVLIGTARFTRSVFYKGEGLGAVTEILFGWPADREGAALTVVGNLGAHFLDRSGLLKKQVRFSKDFRCPVNVARLNASGEYGFLTRDESWAFDATLLDERGQVRWNYHENIAQAVDDSVGDDFDGNGQFHVVIGFNGSGGILLLDNEGKKIWQKPDGNVWHVETLDVNGDGRKEILHSNARGQLLVRDGNGQIIAQYLPDHYVTDFALTRWGTESQANHILIPSKESHGGCCKPVVLVLDASGKTTARFDAPLGDLMYRTQGTPVHFSTEAPYYAVLQTIGPLNRSMVFIYDAEGKITYQEILGDTCFAIASMPERNGDRLLIGCSGNVLEYDAVTSVTQH